MPIIPKTRESHRAFIMRSSFVNFTFFTCFILAACVVPTQTTPTITAKVSPTTTATLTPSITPTLAPSATATEVPTQSPEEIESLKLFKKLGLDFSTYTFNNVNGVITAIDKTTSKEIFKDGKFDLRFAVENLKDLTPTTYKPKPNHGVFINSPTDLCIQTYVLPIYKRWTKEYIEKNAVKPFADSKESGFLPLMLDPNLLAYGLVAGIGGLDEKGNKTLIGEYLIYENNQKEIIEIPIMRIYGLEIVQFYDQ